MQEIIDTAWNDRAKLNTETSGEIRDAVNAALKGLDEGRFRIAQPDGMGGWQVNEWLKRAVLLSFRLNANQIMPGGPAGGIGWDKIPAKTTGWTAENFQQAGFRAVPGSIIRYGSYIAPDAVLMPSFVNIGAYVGERSMIDSWATVGACAQIGSDCHISGGTGIGGVLEPLQAAPVIIENNVFIGARSEIAEGVIVREGSVISMGVYIGASTKIVDRQSGEFSYGEVPPYSVVVPGTLAGANGGPALAAAIIVKRVDAKTRSKTGINDLLRA